MGAADADIEVPVLVIGAGPAGMSTALVLGRLGTRCLLAERRAEVGTLPRATGVRVRTMELFRAWGIHEEIAGRAVPVRDGGEFTWVSTVAGERFGTTSLARLEDPAARRAATPMEVLFCPQDRVEPVLLAELRTSPPVDVRFSSEVTSLRDDGDGVLAVVENRVTGAVTRVRARYVVAADGAASPTRAALGIGLEGHDARAEFVNIDFRADLRPYVGDRPSVLYWVLNSRASGTLAARDGRHRWYFGVLAGGATPADPADPESCLRIVRDAIGVPGLPVEIEGARRWRMDAKVASSWRSGNVFLVGDAAHRFPPTGGFGLNSSIQDGHNLAWKLHWVHSGWAGEGLLNSYEAERRPIAEFNAAQSWRNMDLMAATGFTPDVHDFAAQLEAEAETGAGQQPLRERIRRGIPLQAPQFHALGQDIGFGYGDGSSAVVADGTAVPLGRDPEFEPSGAPGRRVPHHVLRRGGSEVSTLDLVEGRLTLFAARDAGAWTVAARAAARSRQLPLHTQRVAPTPDADLYDPTGDWEHHAGVGGTGAVLVRPDGHVAWRTSTPAGPHAEAELGDVLDTILSRRPR
ncbi:FAD-dependent monooxygenase [Streptomyces sp. NPDC093252]|uniref:FAD-dependent monooxygenase n=1 Tax=Streptomyces sp. NPDC093252 TaxID=3154980 RepID=UPI003421112C